MSKSLKLYCESRSVYLMATCLLPFCLLCADDTDTVLPQVVSVSELGESTPQATQTIQGVSEEAAPAIALEIAPAIAPEIVIAEEKEKPVVQAIAFTPFTGKVRARKLRLRVNPELDGYIVKELNKGDLVSIIGEKDDFWAVEPLADTKAYIFRSFVLDNTVEGSRVNLRLEPSLEAPIIGHMNTGDHVDGILCPVNTKWLEISPPKSIRFYVSKEHIENVGSPEVKVEYEARRSKVEDLLDTTSLLVKAELKKHFGEIDVEKLSHNYDVIIKDFSDFSQYVEQAKSEQAALNESYLKRKIEYLENKANGVDEMLVVEEASEAAKATDPATDKMKLWEPIEESLYLTWARLNEDRTMHEYYDEQKVNSMMVTGIIESYNSAVKNKPGTHILRDEKDLPIAYIYSTHVDLNNLIGKKVNLVASPRPNNNFAFPAYFVHEAE